MADGSHRCESTDIDRATGDVNNGFGKGLWKHRDSLTVFPQSSDSRRVCTACALADISWRGPFDLSARQPRQLPTFPSSSPCNCAVRMDHHTQHKRGDPFATTVLPENNCSYIDHTLRDRLAGIRQRKADRALHGSHCPRRGREHDNSSRRHDIAGS